MEDPNERPPAGTEQPDRTRHAPAKSVPPIVLRTTTDFEWRHVNGIAFIRFLVAVWLVCLASILLAFGYWWGAFLLVVAALVGLLAYLMPRWKLALDAQRQAQTPREAAGG